MATVSAAIADTRSFTAVARGPLECFAPVLQRLGRHRLVRQVGRYGSTKLLRLEEAERVVGQKDIAAEADFLQTGGNLPKVSFGGGIAWNKSVNSGGTPT